MHAQRKRIRVDRVCEHHRVGSVVEQAVTYLRATSADLRSGLTDSEVADIEGELGFQFSDEHREFLAQVLPLGDRWPDWRSGDRTVLADRLARPVEGALFDVANNGFWPQSWGARPHGRQDALDVAKVHLARVPRLVPVYSHRYLPASPANAPAPVLSVHQTDVTYYGNDLADYVAHEFRVAAVSTVAAPAIHIPFWSDLADGVDEDDL
jgi:hypothetical protein